VEIDIHNPAHQQSTWDKLKPVRSTVKGLYGDDSSQYELVGGTRMSDRKTARRNLALEADGVQSKGKPGESQRRKAMALPSRQHVATTARPPKITKSNSLALFAWLEPSQAFFIWIAYPTFGTF
jgi:hypothetical protein